MYKARGSAIFAALAVLITALSPAAETPPAAPAEAAQLAWKAAGEAMQRGPARVALAEQATLALPEGYGYVPPKASAALMAALGNPTDDRLLGLIFPLDEGDWFVSLDFDKAGYIKDDEARDWDAKTLLQSLKDGTEAGNDERRKLGLPAIEVTRWLEPPAYDAEHHRLVWSAEARSKDSPDADPSANYNTYVLGREGYIELNLITSQRTLLHDQRHAQRLLAAVQFNDGKAYRDFNASTDKIAAYGLAALVAGVAAKKLGLLAVAVAFIAKFAKLVFNFIYYEIFEGRIERC
jgi:uncharacterized membrane-anchored protein